MEHVISSQSFHDLQDCLALLSFVRDYIGSFINKSHSSEDLSLAFICNSIDDILINFEEDENGIEDSDNSSLSFESWHDIDSFDLRRAL